MLFLVHGSDSSYRSNQATYEQSQKLSPETGCCSTSTLEGSAFLLVQECCYMLWQQSAVIFQMIRQSSDSCIPDHVLCFVLQPLLCAGVSSPVNTRVLKTYWLNEPVGRTNSFSPSASLVCTALSEFLKTNKTIINLRFMQLGFKWP